jgi:hypothetical protein
VQLTRIPFLQRITGLIGGMIPGMTALTRPTKITFADMRGQGVRGILIYCADYR